MPGFVQMVGERLRKHLFQPAGAETGLMWVRYFDTIKPTAEVPYPGVNAIRFDGNKTLFTNIYDPQAKLTKTFRINIDTGLGDAPIVPSTNNPPFVAITSPANNAAFTAGSNITLQANAVDNDGTIAKVEFFQGSAKLGEESSSPTSPPLPSPPFF